MKTKENANSEATALARTMRIPGVTSLGVGAMIGAGVFVLTGMAAGEAGPALILAFGLNGLVALIVGSCYVELATMMPKAGGAYVWAKQGLGPLFGFLAGWLSAFAQLVACALYAAAFGSFAQTLLTDSSLAPRPCDCHWHCFIRLAVANQPYCMDCGYCLVCAGRRGVLAAPGNRILNTSILKSIFDSDYL